MNRFTRAVTVGNPREFTQGDKEEQEIAEGCYRLIKNAIICWNYLYLSQKLDRMKDPEQKERLLAAIASHSIICWEHMNLLGEYDFSDNKLKILSGSPSPKWRTDGSIKMRVTILTETVSEKRFSRNKMSRYVPLWD